MASHVRNAVLAVGIGIALVAAAVDARQSTPPPSTPVPIQPVSAQQRFRQSVQQSQVRDQLQKNQVESQLRQQSMELSRHRAGTPSNDAQVDKAQQAERQLLQSRQRDALQRYTDAVVPQPVPAEATTAGHGGNNGG